MDDAQETPANEGVARIIDALLEAGEPVDEGQFSIDQDAASAKLEAFQFAEREAYLVALIEGLHALNASRVDLSRAGPDLEIHALGIELDSPEQVLFDLHNHSLGLGRGALSHGLSRVAIGLAMILGDEGVERVLISAGPASAEYRQGQAPRIVRADEGEGTRGLRVFVDRAWTQALRRKVGGSLDRARAALRWSKRVATLDGVTISGERCGWSFERQGQGPGYRFVAGLRLTGDDPSCVELWAHDIIVEQIGAPGIAFRAKIELDDPRRDLSQMKVVRDEALEAALAAVEQARLELVAELSASADLWVVDGWPPNWPRARVEAAIADPDAVPLTAGLEADRGRLLVAAIAGVIGLAIAIVVGMEALSAYSMGIDDGEGVISQFLLPLVVMFGGGGVYALVWAATGGRF